MKKAAEHDIKAQKEKRRAAALRANLLRRKKKGVLKGKEQGKQER